jgi:hypothetical protein
MIDPECLCFMFFYLLLEDVLCMCLAGGRWRRDNNQIMVSTVLKKTNSFSFISRTIQLTQNRD